MIRKNKKTLSIIMAVILTTGVTFTSGVSKVSAKDVNLAGGSSKAQITQQLAAALVEKKVFPQAGKFTANTVTPTYLAGFGGGPTPGPFYVTIAQDTMNQDVINKFKLWRTNFYKTYESQGKANIGYIEGHVTGGVPEWGNEKIVSASEHTGYGMIVFALMAGYLGDNGQCKKDFDSLVRLYQQLKRPNNLMAWAVPATNWDVFKNKTINYKDWEGKPQVGKPELITSATDGDFDIAYALLLAEKQWPGQGKETVGQNYIDMAKAMINKGIAKDLIDKDTFRVKLGDWHKQKGHSWYEDKFSSYLTRSSDFMIENLKAFEYYADSTNKSKFTKSINECYNILEHFYNDHNNKTGLLPDFIDKVGDDLIAPAPQAIYDALEEPFPIDAYSENSCRVPQRLSLDYIHTKDVRAEKYAKAITTFIIRKNLGSSDWFGGPEKWAKVVNGYKLDGASIGTSSGVDALQFISGFVSAAATCKGEAFANGWRYLKGVSAFKSNCNDAYFKDTLALMNMLQMSKNWWSPIQ